jgi:exopolyphosphatase/guanosine-5'-triphosphate,3'-diphosphate pyrophosphatase
MGLFNEAVVALKLKQGDPEAQPTLQTPLWPIHAVIDVGSNSVRLVIYRLRGRAFTPTHNEKVLAGLGRGLAETGMLNPTGKKQALGALSRFSALIRGLDIENVHVVATAAVRDAADGADFVDQIGLATGLKVTVLSGAQEAHYSALGVIAGTPAATGIIGDLGGSSLELVRVNDGVVGPGQTFPLGPLALEGKNGFDLAAIRGKVNAALSSWRERPKAGATLFGVGGSWRALAKLHMLEKHYPLHVLQGFEITAADAIDLSHRMVNPDRAMQSRLNEAAGKRSAIMAPAAIVLAGLLEAGGFSRLVMSSYGVREGLLFDGLSAEERAADPLLVGMEAGFCNQPATLRFARKLDSWMAGACTAMTPVWSSQAAEARVWSAAARLADLGAALHPDHRAQIAFDLVARGPYVGGSHPLRAFLAASASARYSRRVRPNAIERRLLSPEQSRRARALGALMRLGCDFSGRSADLLGQSSIHVRDEALVLEVRAASAGLISETVQKRLGQAAELFDLGSSVAIASD